MCLLRWRLPDRTVCLFSNLRVTLRNGHLDAARFSNRLRLELLQQCCGSEGNIGEHFLQKTVQLLTKEIEDRPSDVVLQDFVRLLVISRGAEAADVDLQLHLVEAVLDALLYPGQIFLAFGGLVGCIAEIIVTLEAQSQNNNPF